MSAETQGAELTYKPADAASAASLFDLIGELHARIEAGRLIGQGDVAIANGIRAQFTERMLDVALDGVPDPEPPSPELMERMRQTRENVVNAATVVAMEDRLAAVERERDEARRALEEQRIELLGKVQIANTEAATEKWIADDLRRALRDALGPKATLGWMASGEKCDKCGADEIFSFESPKFGPSFACQHCALVTLGRGYTPTALAARPAETPEGR